MAIIKNNIFKLFFCFIQISYIPLQGFSFNNDTESGKLAFIENKGQIKDDNGNSAHEVKYYLNLPAANLYFTHQGLVYELFGDFKKHPKADDMQYFTDIPMNGQGDDKKRVTMSRYRMDMQFNNINQNVKINSSVKSSDYRNFYLGNQKNDITLNVGLYQQITYENIYDGIDLVFNIQEGGKGIKYDFIVNPGYDSDIIEYEYKGAEKISVNELGELWIKTPLGNIKEETPYSYQIINGEKREVKSQFHIEKNKVKFLVQGYNKELPLTIDPSVLIYSTYYGGSGTDFMANIIIDQNGDFYAVGTTNSTNFPTTLGVLQPNYGGGNNDAFILKFNSNVERIWATYVGGSQMDNGRSCGLDEQGNLFLIGTTMSLNFPTVDPGGGAYYEPINLTSQNNPNNPSSYVLKLSGTGNLIWSTFLGAGNGIDLWVDNANNLLITGSTSGFQFPISPNAWQANYAGPSSTAGVGIFGDAFVTKFNNQGVLQWSTFLGGSADEIGYGIATDTNQDIYVTGWTVSQDFPVSNDANQAVYGGGSGDAYVAKFTSNGQRVWATYLGGNQDTRGIDCEVINNKLYVAGRTSSMLPGPSIGVAQPNFGGGDHDGFVAKYSLQAGANNLLWRTHLGGSGNEIVDEISRFKDGYIAVAGNTNSTNFPTTPNSFQETLAGNNDAFLTLLDSTGALFCSTFFGGSADDYGYALRCNNEGIAYIGGAVESSAAQSFPFTPDAFQQNTIGSQDGFIAKLDIDPPTPDADFTADNLVDCIPFTIDFVNNSNSKNTCTSITTYQWSFPGGTPTSSSDEVPPPITYAQEGTYTVTLTITNILGSSTTTQTVQALPPAPSAAWSIQPSICENDPILNLNTLVDASLNGVFSGQNVTSNNFNPQGLDGEIEITFTVASGECENAETQSIQVINLPVPEVDGLTNYCPEDDIESLLVSNADEFNINWYSDAGLNNQEHTGNNFIPESASATYYVVFEKDGCISSATQWDININTIQAIIEANTDVTFQPFELIANNASINSTNCEWFLNDEPFDYVEGSAYLIEELGEYSLKLVCENDEGCKSTDEILFTVELAVAEITIPNVFTPNGDGINDKFEFEVKGIKTLTGTILNRWGNVVYEWEGFDNYWDGVYANNEAPDGVYFYVVRIIDIFDEADEKKGTVTLIR